MKASLVAPLDLSTGLHPRASLLLGPDGKLYGTTWSGSTEEPGGGAVICVDPASGTATAIHRFSALDVTGRNDDGYGPVAPLSMSPSGWLYGTARQGGRGGNPIRPAPGVVFSCQLDGSEFSAEYFSGGPRDGGRPHGGLAWDGDRAYGATADGTFYTLDGPGIRTLATFDPLGADRTNRTGANPYGSPIIERADDNAIIGMTVYGGAFGAGTIYRRHPGLPFEVIYDFSAYEFAGNTDNAPLQSLMRDSRGTLWGTHEFGGRNGTGLIFRVERTLVVVHEFGVYDAAASPRFSNADGALPICTPCEGPDGRIYGTTYYGGEHGLGGVWSIGKDGMGFRLELSFASSAHDAASVGAYPQTGLTVGSDGRLYGATFLGGAVGGGAIYALDP